MARPHQCVIAVVTAAVLSTFPGWALAESAPPRGGPVTGAVPAVKPGISAVDVLTLAKNEAEKEPDLARRYNHLTSFARALRDRGQEAALGSFVVDTIGVNKEPESRSTLDHQYSARRRRAKEAFLAGDLEAAKRHLDDCSDRPKSGTKCPADDRYWFFPFQQWTLEAGRVDEALQRLKAGVSLPGHNLVQARLEVAGVLRAAGRQAQAWTLLRELRSEPSVYPPSLAMALWAVGAVDEARLMLREAAAAALAVATKDVSAPLPIELVRVQLHMGDRDGALVTLRGIRGLEVPVEEDPARQSPDDRKYGSLTPASARWATSRGRLARNLARAGLDGEAWKLVDAPLADQKLYIESIARGQADRGDFDAAFATIDKLRTAALLEPADYWDRRRSSAPMKAATHDGPARAAFAIRVVMQSAARKADVPALRRVFALLREAYGVDVNLDALKWLAEAGRPDDAVALALGAASMAHRISALIRVAEGITLRAKLAADPVQDWLMIHESPPAQFARR
jgi:hypothetical protein